eukprot:124470_1
MKQNQIANNTSNTSIPNSQTKRPIELWQELRAGANAKRAYHFPLWNFRDEISTFKHDMDYDHFCIVYFKLHPLLNTLYDIPAGISKYIAEYATGFFDTCDNCKSNVHIFYGDHTDKTINFRITSKCVKDKYPFINISCLCNSCKTHHINIKTVGDGTEVFFRLKTSTRMKKLMKARAVYRGTTNKLLYTFQINEKQKVFIMNEMTAHDLGMKDEDIIHVSHAKDNKTKSWTFNSEFKWD